MEVVAVFAAAAVFVGVMAVPVVISERRRLARERVGAEFERYRAGMARATARAREQA